MKFLALLLASLLTAAPAQAEKVLRYALRSAETGFDPAQISDLYSKTIAAAMFDGLLEYDFSARPYRLRPNTATALPEVSADARTFTVKVKIDPATAPPLGSTVHVVPQALAAKGLQAIKLPTTALRQEGQATAVWVYEADKGTVRSQVVQVATADGNDAVIVGGLTPGMQVVSTGVHVLTPGQKVVVFQQKSAPGQSGQAQAATKSGANQASCSCSSQSRTG